MTVTFDTFVRPTAEQVNALPKGIIARSTPRTTNSSASTGLVVAVLRIDDVPLVGGRSYDVYTRSIFLDTTVANDVGDAKILFTTDGSTPTITSAQLPGAWIRQFLGNATFGGATPILVDYHPAADQTLSLLLCVQRVTGTGSVIIQGTSELPIQMAVKDIGTDPGGSSTNL